ncbi:separase [Sarracenia purpurea var. burkii]
MKCGLLSSYGSCGIWVYKQFCANGMRVCTMATFTEAPCRINCCDLMPNDIHKIVSLLMLAFVRSQEVPVLVQKVSRLLAVIFVISASTEIFSLNISPCKALSESHWVSYFHQASLGTHLNHKFLPSVIGKQKVKDPMDVEVCFWVYEFASCLDTLFQNQS